MEKLKFDIRTEYVPLTTVKKICEQNDICIKIRGDRSNTRSNVVTFGSTDSEFKAEICCIKDHFFKYVENTGVTYYFLKNYEDLKTIEDGHLYYRKGKKTKYRFLNSYMLVSELIKQQDI